MKRLKKLSRIILMTMFSVITFYTISQAYSVGQKILVTSEMYRNQEDLFCVQFNQQLRLPITYNVSGEVILEGNKSTDQKGGNVHYSEENAKLVYILNEKYKPGPDYYNRKGPKNTSTKANAIWREIGPWTSNVGKYYGFRASNLAGGVVPGDYGHNESEVKKLLEDANQYAKNFNNENEKLEIKDNTNKDKITPKTFKKDDKIYVRVGPFNWTFPETLKELKIYDQKNKEISGILYSSYKGKEEIYHSVDEIVSGKDFYLSFPVDKRVTKITKISAKTKEYDIYKAKMFFLQPAGGVASQNLITIEPSKERKPIEVTFTYNEELTGCLEILKVDEQNPDKKLPNVQFRIKKNNIGKFVKKNSDGTISYVTKAEATAFKTNSKGIVKICGLLPGEYTIYEYKNPNPDYIIPKEGIKVSVKTGSNSITKITIKNTPKVKGFKLSGYVWEDKVSGKQSLRNDLYKDNDYDSEDTLIAGITVRLKEKNGKVVKETKTDENGKYQFIDVDREKLKDYLIEFEYDGITYTNVVPHIDKDNGSKAAENSKEREEFNNGFSAIEGNGDNTGYTLDQNGNKKHNLSYEKDTDKHTSTFINEGKYPIKANTDVAGYILSEHENKEKDEIININLGLYRREQPDLAVIKDIDNVKLTVNGYEHIYEYAQRFNNQGEYGDGFNVGVKFGNKYGSMEYTRPIYKADYEYTNENDKSKELKAYITYKIAVRNESTNLISQINSLVDYFDSKYSVVAIGTNRDKKTSNISENLDYETSDYNGEYSKLIIKPNKKIEAQKTYELYVQFELNREAILNIMNDGENLDNVVEINSYSTFGVDGKSYAGIDVDSNPGNAKPGDKSTYEDDTDSSPALKLKIAEDRELSGKVFLDETNMPNLETNKERKGNGRYDEGEKGIPGVTVTLTEISGNGKVYTTTTDDGGNYDIPALEPGEYKITFTWGDDTYTVQNYKGTIYDPSRNQNDDQWYKTDIETRLSDAIDNYDTRKQIDEEMKEVQKGNKKEYTIKRMESTTPVIRIPEEYDKTETDSTGDKFVYKAKNIDFGIVERPRQEIELKKRVKNMKLTLANGQVITDIEIDENGKITGQKDGIVYMGPSQNTEPKNGFLKLEMDNELIEGSKLEITYQVKAINKSELDYATEEYYKYGTTGGQVVTIVPSAVIDYLDKDWGFDNEKNPDWTVKTIEEIKNLVAEVVYNNEESTINNKIILYTEKLRTELKPSETKDVALNVSKILTTAEDISLDNETEIIKVDKPHGGSDIPSTPGNYIPGTGEKEPDDSTSETVIITPSTGANMNFIIPISVGLVALVILGTGVVFIKKKVLNK